MKAAIVQPTFDKLLNVPRDNENLVIYGTSSDNCYHINLRHIYPDNTVQAYEVTINKQVNTLVSGKYAVLMEVLRKLHEAQVAFDEEEKNHVNKSIHLIQPANKKLIIPN